MENPQNENHAEESLPQGNQPQNAPEMTLEQRVTMHEHFLAEAMKSHQMSGQAINRLESYVFVLVDIIMKNNMASLEEIKALQDKLSDHDDLLTFWGAPKEESDATSSK